MGLRYLNEFLRLRCAPDILAVPHILGSSPAKEVTESMGAWEAVRHVLNDGAQARDDVVCCVVGDGHLPRTGALVAHLTKWEVISVDPEMRSTTPELRQMKRLYPIKAKLEDLCPPAIRFHHVVIIGVHSHAPAQLSWDFIQAREKLLVLIPCCVRGAVTGDFDWKFSREDKGILSPHNRVRMYYKRDADCGDPIVKSCLKGVKFDD